LLAVLPLETQERITDALMEIEEDLQAEAMEESMLSEAQPSETLMGYVNEALAFRAATPPARISVSRFVMFGSIEDPGLGLQAVQAEYP
jgi:hypothetical protein